MSWHYWAVSKRPGFEALALLALLGLLHLDGVVGSVASDGRGEAHPRNRCLMPKERGLYEEAIPADECCCGAEPLTAAEAELAASASSRIAFMIGAQKSGTTFLHEELVKRHPKVLSMQTWSIKKNKTVDMKEPHYFDRTTLGPISSYLEGMNLNPGSSDPSATFLDSTPDYIHVPSAACRMKAVFPNARIVVVLKDPVARAFSGWNMLRVTDATTKPFDVEVEKEISALRKLKCSYEPDVDADSDGAFGNFGNRELEGSEESGTWSETTGGWSRVPGMPSWNECFRCSFSYCAEYNGPKSTLLPRGLGICPGGVGRGIIRRGLYVYQVEWWLQHFPPEQLLFINHAEVQVAPEDVLDKIIRFLGYDPADKATFQKKSFGYRLPYSKNHTSLYAGQFDMLYRFFEHANKELYALMTSLGPSSGWLGTFPSSFEAPRH